METIKKKKSVQERFGGLLANVTDTVMPKLDSLSEDYKNNSLSLQKMREEIRVEISDLKKMVQSLVDSDNRVTESLLNYEATSETLDVCPPPPSKKPRLLKKCCKCKTGTTPIKFTEIDKGLVLCDACKTNSKCYFCDQFVRSSEPANMESVKKEDGGILCWRKHCKRHEFEHDVPFKKGDYVTVPYGFFADIREENKCTCLHGWKGDDKKDPATAETIQIVKRTDENFLPHSQYEVKITWENSSQKAVLCHHWMQFVESGTINGPGRPKSFSGDNFY